MSGPAARRSDRARRLAGALVDAGVAFIVVGGVAGTAHGAARLTQDLDVVYARDPDIVAALAPHADA